MSIKIGVNPNNPNQIQDGVNALLGELRKQSGPIKSGIIAFQYYNQISWSSLPNDEGYKKHGFISMDNPSAGGDGKVHKSEGISFEGLDGQINILGGAWQNAIYQITLSEKPKEIQNTNSIK